MNTITFPKRDRFEHPLLSRRADVAVVKQLSQLLIRDVELLCRGGQRHEPVMSSCRAASIFSESVTLTAMNSRFSGA